jgi:hypothetical protein
VRVKLTVDVRQRHKGRNFSQTLKLFAAGSQLRWDEGKSETRVDLLFRRSLFGDGSQALDMQRIASRA